MFHFYIIWFFSYVFRTQGVLQEEEGRGEVPPQSRWKLSRVTVRAHRFFRHRALVVMIVGGADEK